MLYTPLWKRILIWSVVALGLLWAMPNAFYSRVEGHNDALLALERDQVLTPEQEAARAGWPDFLPSRLMNLGLDLRGGAHLLAEVQVADVYTQRMDVLWPEVRDALRDLRAQTGAVRRQPAPDGVLRVRIENPDGMPAAVEAVRALASPVVSLTGVGSTDIEVSVDGQDLVVHLSEAERQATDTRTMQQSLEIIRRRVDEVGTREPTIQRQGADRILIQVPGIGSAQDLKELIGTTAQLTFNRVISTTGNPDAPVQTGEALLPAADQEGVFYVIDTAPVVSGDELVDAQPAFDQNNRPAVNFRFNPTGARTFGDYTAANIGQPFAIVLDGQVISAPVIQSHIPGGSGIITGRFTPEESTQLAVLLRAGALPAELTFLEERTIGPELGADSIAAGQLAAVLSLAAVFAFMILAYGLFGVFACLALLANLVLLFAALTLIGATLTLPGIAGIVLTLGMAVDANVLIYERMRDEIRAGKKPVQTITAGFSNALSAIVDSNVTTLLVALIMFTLGAGPTRGFAVTLGIGILTTLFSAVFITRLIIEQWFAWRQPKTLDV
jgi:preprotein translocase subunit SecD